MTKHSIAKSFVFAAAILALPALSMAGTDTKESREAQPIVEKVKETWISGDLGVSVVSEYVSRGFPLEDKGVMAQPYLDLYFKLYESEGFLNKISFNLGLWGSLHSHVQPAAETSSTRNWFEFDYTAGLAFTFDKNFMATLSYFEYTFPSDVLGTSRSLNLNLAYDDTDLLGAFALHPHAAVLYELGAPGFAGIRGKGWYYEVGIAPSYVFCKASPYAVTLTVPVTVGLGDDRFYAGDTFGYVSVGAQLSVPLAFIPEKLGAWTLSGGYTYSRLGDNAATLGSLVSTDQDLHVFQGTVNLAF